LKPEKQVNVQYRDIMWIWDPSVVSSKPINQDLPRRVARHVIKLSVPMEATFGVIEDTACTLI
jgi:hypothetical protein